MDAEKRLEQVRAIVYSDLSSSKARLLTMIAVAPDPIIEMLGELHSPFVESIRRGELLKQGDGK